jgi:general secretion pathway protein E
MERLALPALLAATPLIDRFAPRFLRESTIFPFQSDGGIISVAVADPSDTAAIRAAEIVFGGPVEIAVASFEDIATVLDQRLDADGAATDVAAAPTGHSDDDIGEFARRQVRRLPQFAQHATGISGDRFNEARAGLGRYRVVVK